MKDIRFEQLAKILIHHSTKLGNNDKVLIEAIDTPPEMILALLRQAKAVGGIPFVTLKNNLILREIYHQASEASMSLVGKWEAARMAEMDAYIGLRGNHNISELSDVPNEKMRLYQSHWWKPVHLDIRVPKTRWVVLRWPHPGMAQQAGMSTEAFEDFYFQVCTLDYGKMSAAMDALVQRMQRTGQVHILGPGTDLNFSIKGIPVIKCDGGHNIPDGEVYTAPVKDSVNGVISFNARSIYHGQVHENIVLGFESGKIISATSNKTDELHKILDTDEGARFVGEFAVGLNPLITRPMLDILFDEKIAGSFHFTPGSCYDQAFNGNKSQIHWDMVCIQTPEYGGGEIYFDGQLIRKDGRFVTPDLQLLNPEHMHSPAA